MSYKTFTGRTVDEAKRAMRRELGSDAVVLATRRRSDGAVELRAIKRGEPLFKGEGGGSSGGLFGQRERRDPPPAPSLGGLREPRVTERSGDGGSPLSDLRGDFSRKLQGGQRSDDPLTRSWTERLGQHGLTPELIARLVDAAHDFQGRGDEADRLAYALERTLRFAPINILRDAPLMLIGQTGAGKTSSAAKLAASAAAMGGRLAFISADVGRAGAIEQMQTYADALDTRFWAVEEPRQVAHIVRNERPRESLILDTPGVSPFASADVAAVRAFREALGAEMVLVIPASGDVNEHMDWVSAFAELGVR
ncbi:MAG: hypothetical protein V2I43_14870, partial [Parvularcula sp.]|nr:hypothetical protein [Parvularcula sp.]